MIDPAKYGVSFSLKQCRAFGIEPKECLEWLLAQGWRRFRLMSYWAGYEKEQGKLDFTALDWQIGMIAKAGGVVTLCLGVKQPRWPEYHWPEWAWQLDKPARDEALFHYVQAVVERYKDNPAVVSWQLENEALLQGFGRRIDIDRHRLRNEYELIKRLDPTRPVIMSASNGWGIPLRRPRPDIVGFSYYPTMYKKGRYSTTVQKPWFERLRRHLVRQPVFIHELQCEPWGPKPIWQMPVSEQDKSMNPAQIKLNLAAARRIGAYPIDLWGAEYWYYRMVKLHDPSIWNAAQAALAQG
jgi:hypothetical protein